mmetsp:Transcript_21166/g.34925  ORF Transcript_21166/g.34925 Transcript_21166/m.34925 type:complete len:99 (+) Transcript_21166:38-334(+)
MFVPYVVLAAGLVLNQPLATRQTAVAARGLVESPQMFFGSGAAAPKKAAKKVAKKAAKKVAKKVAKKAPKKSCQESPGKIADRTTIFSSRSSQWTRCR